MTAKYGLHKNISSIFDGVPAASNAAPQNKPAPAAESGPAAPTKAPAPAPAPAKKPERNMSPSKTQNAKPAPNRPKGVRTAKNKNAKKDSRQAKMLVLVGVLAVVFIGVLYMVLGGSTQPTGKPPAADAANPANTAPNTAPAANIEITWQKPEPWPDTLRDPMQFGKAPAADEQPAGPGECTVKGIVFSATRPTAIIGDQIVAAGEVVNGVTIVNITKNSVEFEKDGQTWTQQVRP